MKTKFFSEISLAHLLSIMPRGIHVAYFGLDESIKQMLSKIYRLSNFNFELNELIHYNLDNKNANFEDLKLIVAHKNIPLAKQFASKFNATLIIIGCQSLLNYDYIITNKSLNIINQPINSVFLTSLDNYAVCFCQCINALSTIIDNEIAYLIYQKPTNQSTKEKIINATSNLIFQSLNLTKNSKEIENLLIKTQLQISLALNLEPPSLSGSFQSAVALNLLMLNENRNPLDIDINCFLLSPYILRIYYAFLNSKVDFCFPKNNNLRSNRLINFLGLKAKDAHNLTVISQKNIQLNDYRLSLYGANLKNTLIKIISLIDKAYIILLKLFEDDGYFLRDYIDNNDILVALSLGADVINSPTLLNYMKDKGVLDNYL